MVTQDERAAGFERVLALFLNRGKLQSLFSRIPTVPSKSEVFKILESVDYRTRLYYVIRLGAEASKQSSIKQFISELESGDFTERHLALSSVHGSRDGAHIIRALEDRSKQIRDAAVSLVALVCTDEECVRILVAANTRQRDRIVRGLARRKRAPAIEAFLRRMKSEDPNAYLAFVAWASRSFIEDDWTAISPQLNADLWTRLARQHPELATAKLRDLIERTVSFDPRVLLLANSVLRVIAKCQPELTLDLTKELLRLFPLSQLQIHGVVPYKTAEIAGLMLTQGSSGSLNLEASLYKLSPQLVGELIEKQLVSTFRADSWLKKFPAARRATLFLNQPDSWRSSDGFFSASLLALLPAEIRERYATEHFASPQLQTRPEKRLPYIGLLRWAESRLAAQPFLGDPDAELRSLALGPLISSIRFSRASAAEMLTLVNERRFEQDPVRLIMLQSVARLPPTVWKASHLDALGSVIRSALDAKDLSTQSLGVIHELLLRLMPLHFEQAAQWFLTVIKERSITGMQGLEPTLNEHQVQRLGSLILPVLKGWKTQENEHALLRIASCFGRKLKYFVGLIELVEDLVERASSSSVSESALNVLRYQCRLRFDTLVPRLLKSDATWSLKHPIITFLHERRDDLLTPYLGQNAISGKFSTGKTRIVPSFSNGFHRWSSTQRKIYSDSLTAMTKDLTRKNSDFFYALRFLAYLPEPPLPVFLAFTRTALPEHVVVRDFAIQSLAALDGGEGLDELVLCLGDDRARVAIYSLRNALADIPQARALNLLENVPRKKVTISKEVIRLIGELKSPEAQESLLTIANESLERDVRIALHRALWDYLEDSRTWHILHAAAQVGDTAISLHLSRIPAERLGEFSRSEFLKLLATLFETADSRLRVALLNRIATMPVPDESFILREALFRSLESDNADEFTAAANALLSAFAIRSPSVIEEAARRALPRRRNLSALVSSMFTSLRRDRNSFSPSARALLPVLAADSKTSGIHISLFLAVSPWTEIKKALFEPATVGNFHAGTIASCISAFHAAAERPDAAELDDLEQSLASHPSELLRRFGLAALVGAAGGNRGWTEERLNRLRHYRNDSSTLVAEAAEFTFPAAEFVILRKE